MQTARSNWKPWHVGILMMILTPAIVLPLSATSIAPLWLIWLVLLGLLLAIYAGRPAHVGPLAGRGLKICATGAFLVSAFILMIVGSVHLAEAAQGEEAAKLRLLVARGGEAASVALTTADPLVLAVLAAQGVEPAKQEIERRNEAEQQQRAAADEAASNAHYEAGLQLERRNKRAIAAEQARVDAMAKEDSEGRLAGYRRLIALAPMNRHYQNEAGELIAHIDDLQRRIDHPEANIEVVRSSWSKAGFGNVYMLDITLRNTGTRPWKDFEIVCRNQAPSGTLVAANRGTILEILAPGQKRRYREVNLGLIDPQAAGSRCEVEGASPA